MRNGDQDRENARESHARDSESIPAPKFSRGIASRRTRVELLVGVLTHVSYHAALSRDGEKRLHTALSVSRMYESHGVLQKGVRATVNVSLKYLLRYFQLESQDSIVIS